MIGVLKISKCTKYLALLLVFIFISVLFPTMSVVAAAPANGAAYWNFNEGSGTTAADSWRTNSGTLVGPVWTSGVFGNSLSFDGVDDYVNVNKADIPVPWTASMWVKRIDNTAASTGLMGSSTCALKIEQFNNTNKVGFTKYGVADYVFNYTVPT